MKKITLMVFIFLTSFLSHAQFSEGFEGTWTAGSGPAGWRIRNVAGPSQTWQQASGTGIQVAYEGQHAAYLNRETLAPGTLSEDWLITPLFNVPTNGQLHYFSKLGYDLDQGTIFKVFIGTNPEDPSSFTELGTWTDGTLNVNQLDYEEKVLALPAASYNTQRCLAFVMMGNNGERWLIDNVSVSQECFAPTNLTAGSSGSGTANLNWNNPSGATSWEIEIVPQGTTPTQSGTVYSGALPYVASGLADGQVYSYYVRAICAADNKSAWTGPFSFTANQCVYTFNLLDSWGDGWNNGTMQVRQGGVVVSTLALPAGSAATVSVTLSSGVPFELFWNAAGTFPGEMGVSVVNPFGQTIFTKAPGSGSANTVLYTGLVDCANPACLAPTGSTLFTATDTTATLQWGGATTGTWEYFYGPVGTAAPTAATAGTPTTTNPVTITGLTASTSYVFYVRMVCNGGAVSPWSAVYTFSTTQVPAILNYNQDFETSNDMVLVNGTQTNKWFYGTAVSNSPTHSLYITNNNGTGNTYTINTSSTVMAYRDIAIPASAVEARLSFDWRNAGENCCDYIRVWLVPVSYNPVAGTQTTAANSGGVQIGGNFVSAANWTNFNEIRNVSAYANRTMRLIFEWRNDGSVGTQPPGAIDNVNLTLITCPQPTNLAFIDATTTEATFSWAEAGTATSWEVFVVPVSDPAPTATSTGTIVTSTTYTMQNLTASTAYKVYVRAICSATDSSFWTGPVNFSTDDLCLKPTNLQPHCLDNTSGTFDWAAGSNETAWEVAVVPTSAAIPTTGTVVTDNAYFADGLTVGTSYTIYVRAICADGSGYSSWTTLPFVTRQESPGSAQALCAGLLSVPQPSNFGGSVPAYGQVGCLFSTPNPTWYYVTVSSNSEVVLNLTQTSNAGNPIDVDFAAFGPFASKAEACYLIGNPLNTSYIVDCSYSASATETINLTGQPGQVFALLVTNFNGAQGTTTITQTAGGPISCMPTVDVGADRTFCATGSYNMTATVDNPGEAQVYTYQWFRDGAPITPVVVNTTATSQTVTLDTPGVHVYSVIVTMPNPIGSDPVTDQATISLSPPFTVPTPAAISVCGQSGSAPIDLAAIDFLGTLDPAAYVLTLHTSPTDALTGGNAIDTSVPFTATTQTIYVSVADVNMPQCRQIVQLQITISNSAVAAISYTTPLCTTTTAAPVTQTGNIGGVYSSATGLTIDAATGTINPSTSTAGTYTVSYFIAATATCPELTTTFSVEILQAPEATISYGTNTYCNNAGVATVTFTGSTGGVFASDAGLTIDPVTGEVTLATSTIGTHTVTYTIAANGPCAQIVESADIIISAAFVATIDYGTVPFCTNGGAATVTQTGDTGGVYTTDAAVTIDAVTGEITLATSTPGVYTVTYTIPASASCQEFVTTAQVTIEGAPEATFSYGATPYCSNGGIATVTFTGTTGGTFSAVGNIVIDPLTGEVNLATSDAGTYDVYYTVADTAACLGQQFGPATITITTLPVAAINYANSPYCSDGGVAVVTFTGDAGGVYSATPAGLVINSATGDVDLATSVAGTYDVVYTIVAAGGCPEVVSAPAQIVITTLPVADFQYEFASFCTNAAALNPVFVGGGVAGVFTADLPGLTLDSATGAINPATSTPGTYIVTNTIVPAGGCTPVPVTQTVTVTPAPIATFEYTDLAYCVEGTAIPTPILDGDSGAFTSTPAGLVIDAATGIIDLDNSQPGSYVVTNTIAGSPSCPTVVASTDVIISSLPVVAVTQGCDGTEYKLTLSLDGDPVYSVDDVTIAWYLTTPGGTSLGSGENQVISGPGTYYVTVTPGSGAVCPVTQEVIVDDTICEIPRGISPNNDGKNDAFDLTGYGVTKLAIFNRYGQEVYNHNGAYTDQFKGNAKNGDELPTGTYFYMIVRNTGESKTGWVYINRQD